VQFRLEISGPRSRDELLDRLRDLERGHKEEREMRAAAQALYGEYRRGRVLAVRARLTVTNAQVISLKTAEEPPDRALRRVLAEEDLLWLPPSNVRALTEPCLEEWRWGITPTERLLQNLLYQLHQLWNKAREEENRTRLRATSDAIQLVNDSLLKVLAINKALREKTQWDECPPGPWEEAWKLNEEFKRLSIPSLVGDLVHKAARCFLHTAHVCGRFEHWSQPKDVVSAMLLVEVLTQSFAPPSRAMEKLSPEFRFLRLGPDHMGPLFNEDWSADLADRKLYGLRCYHFAAFMSEGWRRHDFTWGRLDSAHYLLGLLSGQTGEETERKLHEAILMAEKLPGKGSPTERMRDRLKEVVALTDDQVLVEGLHRKHRRNMLRPLGWWHLLPRTLLLLYLSNARRRRWWRCKTKKSKVAAAALVIISIVGVMLWLVLYS
jgi:hypothetical protein